jgi:hypothetical protein
VARESFTPPSESFILAPTTPSLTSSRPPFFRKKDDPVLALNMELAPTNDEADDGDRTRDPQLGKLMLYQLSYVRVRPKGSEG